MMGNNPHGQGRKTAAPVMNRKKKMTDGMRRREVCQCVPMIQLNPLSKARPKDLSAFQIALIFDTSPTFLGFPPFRVRSP